MRKIYLDHAATTPVDNEVLKEMQPYFSKKFGNPSTLYSIGQESKEALEKSREKVASLINAEAKEIVFTSGGTESDNLAIKGVAFANKGKHIITSVIEHTAVLETCKFLENNGFEVTYLPVDKCGLISLGDLERAITKDTILVSIMHANNEIGTIQPIEKIGKICKENKIYFHTDAVQSAGKIPIDVKKMNVDLLSISSHKLYGPKGVGALYVRKGVDIEPIIHGGGHEFKLRSGTENVSCIVGFAKAVELSEKNMEKEGEREKKLRDKLIKGCLDIENSWLNGHHEKRMPNNVNVCFKFIEGESLILMLDDKEIEASTGSACSSASLKPSHVLTAIGLKPEEAHGSLRLTLGKENNEKEIDYVLEVLPGIVKKLREISPFKKKW